LFNLALWLEIRRWRGAGRAARLWWRDDDATGLTPSLERLLAVARNAEAPLTLAVIPDGDMRGLGERLTQATQVNVVQHGVDHRNRRDGAAAGEFPHDWPAAQVAIALRRGWSLMQALPRAAMVFTPPWNDVHPELETALRVTGYAGWSANGGLGVAGTPTKSSIDLADFGLPESRCDSLPRIDVHLDLLRWRGGARFRGDGPFLDGLAGEMRRRRRAGQWSAPIGVLTHHLDHDDAAWAFLEAFLLWSRAEPAMGWVSLPQALAEASRGRSAAAQLPPRRSLLMQAGGQA
jgi:hypothetical protein